MCTARPRRLALLRKLPPGQALAGVPDTAVNTLGHTAELSYVEYLRRATNPPDREQIVRRRFDVAPWRLW